jgi:hypothetical protein
MAQTANRYQLSCTGIELDFFVADIGGEPSLTLRIDGEEVSARGDEVDVESTPIGTLVSVDLPFAAVPDQKGETYSALLPAVNVEYDPVRIWAPGIRTTQLTSIGGPDLVDGPLQTYEVMILSGEASVVET